MSAMTTTAGAPALARTDAVKAPAPRGQDLSARFFVANAACRKQHSVTLGARRGRSITVAARAETNTDAVDSLSRREILAGAAMLAVGSNLTLADEASAANRRVPKNPPLDDFTEGPTFQYRGEERTGVKYYDLAEGSGAEVKLGDSVLLHYDVKLGPIVVISSRSARLLGANRSIAEPQSINAGKIPRELEVKAPKKKIIGVGVEVRYQGDELMVAGATANGPADRAGLVRGDQVIAIGGKRPDPDTVGIYQVADMLKGPLSSKVELTVLKVGQTAPIDIELEREEITLKEKAMVMDFVEGGGGLYAGKSDLKAPPAMYQGVLGMKTGGRRLIYAEPDIGYDDDGYGEIPPNKAFYVEVEVLKVG